MYHSPGRGWRSVLQRSQQTGTGNMGASFPSQRPCMTLRHIFPLWHIGNNFSCLCSKAPSGNGIIWCSLFHLSPIRTSPTGIQVLAQVLSSWGPAIKSSEEGHLSTLWQLVSKEKAGCVGKASTPWKQSLRCAQCSRGWPEKVVGTAGKRWVGWCLQLLWWQLGEILLQ